jgi:hypothetical protein
MTKYDTLLPCRVGVWVDVDVDVDGAPPCPRTAGSVTVWAGRRLTRVGPEESVEA